MKITTYLEKKFFERDTHLIKFVVNKQATYVRYRYDLTKAQVSSICEAAKKTPYNGESVETWIRSVMDEAHKDEEAWKYEFNLNAWKYWYTDECAVIEV